MLVVVARNPLTIGNPLVHQGARSNAGGRVGQQHAAHRAGESEEAQGPLPLVG